MDNQRNLSLFLHSSDSIYYLTTDRDGKYTYVNDLYFKIFGGASEDITCENFSTTLFPEDLLQFLEAREDCLNNPGQTSCADLRRSRADGSMFWTRWEFCALIENDTITGIQAIGNDITERKREESEKIIAQNNLQLLLNNTEEAFIMVDRDLNILTFNKSAEQKMFRFFGRYLKKGLSILLFADPERTIPLRKLYLDVLKGSQHESSTRIIEKDRTIIYNNAFKAAYDSDNRIVGIIVTSRDITQNTFAEEKLNRERYLLRTLIDHIPDYIYVKDTNSRHIINNLANLKLMGAANEEETIGKTARDYFDETSALILLKGDQAVLQSGTSLNNVEESIINKAGEKKWLLTTKVPLKEEDGRVIGLVGISRDISERKKIEESLRLSMERSSILSKATNDAIWDWDLTTGQIIWNDAVKLFGFTNEEISADPDWWQHHLHPEDRERVMKKILGFIEEGIESWQDQYRFNCADGSYKSIFDRGFILFNNEHKPVRMIGAMVDVSDRVKLQDELTAHKIARQRHITEAAIMAQEKERAEIGRELHDNINQILTTTKLYIDMAMNEKDISEELMLKSHSNISEAIEEIRILSKSLVPPSLGDIGLREAISEMIGNLNNSQKIKIKLRANGFSKVDIDGNIKLMIFRIVQEQLNNILKHSKASEAEIKLVVSKENLNITVTDNGIGFDTRKKSKGIGLTNITSRAEVHNGQVDIISSPGHGCTLKISIPV